MFVILCTLEMPFWNQMQSNVQGQLFIINLPGKGAGVILSWKCAHLGFICGTSSELGMGAQSDYNHHTVVAFRDVSLQIARW